MKTLHSSSPNSIKIMWMRPEYGARRSCKNTKFYLKKKSTLKLIWETNKSVKENATKWLCRLIFRLEPINRFLFHFARAHTDIYVYRKRTRTSVVFVTENRHHQNTWQRPYIFEFFVPWASWCTATKMGVHAAHVSFLNWINHFLAPRKQFRNDKKKKKKKKRREQSRMYSSTSALCYGIVIVLYFLVVALRRWNGASELVCCNFSVCRTFEKEETKSTTHSQRNSDHFSSPNTPEKMMKKQKQKQKNKGETNARENYYLLKWNNTLNVVKTNWEHSNDLSPLI